MIVLVGLRCASDMVFALETRKKGNKGDKTKQVPVIRHKPDNEE